MLRVYSKFINCHMYSEVNNCYRGRFTTEERERMIFTKTRRQTTAQVLLEGPTVRGYRV